MKYVFNPRNRQINPVTDHTFTDESLRNKEVSPELYALVCQRKVTVEDIAAMFAVNKSPEILVKNHQALKDSPQKTAPENKAELKGTPDKPVVEGPGDENDPADANGAFDGRELCSKKVPELLILASSIGIDINADDFAPTRGNLIKAIRAKASSAAGEVVPAEAPQV